MNPLQARSYCVIHPGSDAGEGSFRFTRTSVELGASAVNGADGTGPPLVPCAGGPGASPPDEPAFCAFDRVFEPGSSQEAIFEELAQRSVADAVRQLASAAFIALGATGGGKTFTVTGGVQRFADRGLIPRSISTLFAELGARHDRAEFQVYVSFFEVYKDSIVDLFSGAAHRVPLQQSGAAKGAVVGAALRQLASNENDAYHMLFQGDANRHFEKLPLNEETSRGHVVYELRLLRTATGREATLAFVDLAVGVAGRDVAGNSVPRSLRALGTVLEALRDRRQRPSFDASPLTQVLRPWLRPAKGEAVPNVNLIVPFRYSRQLHQELRCWLDFATLALSALQARSLADAASTTSPTRSHKLQPHQQNAFKGAARGHEPAEEPAGEPAVKGFSGNGELLHGGYRGARPNIRQDDPMSRWSPSFGLQGRAVEDPATAAAARRFSSPHTADAAPLSEAPRASVVPSLDLSRLGGTAAAPGAERGAPAAGGLGSCRSSSSSASTCSELPAARNTSPAPGYKKSPPAPLPRGTAAALRAVSPLLGGGSGCAAAAVPAATAAARTTTSPMPRRVVSEGVATAPSGTPLLNRWASASVLQPAAPAGSAFAGPSIDRPSNHTPPDRAYSHAALPVPRPGSGTGSAAVRTTTPPGTHVRTVTASPLLAQARRFSPTPQAETRNLVADSSQCPPAMRLTHGGPSSTMSGGATASSTLGPPRSLSPVVRMPPGGMPAPGGNAYAPYAVQRHVSPTPSSSIAVGAGVSRPPRSLSPVRLVSNSAATNAGPGFRAAGASVSATASAAPVGGGRSMPTPVMVSRPLTPPGSIAAVQQLRQSPVVAVRTPPLPTRSFATSTGTAMVGESFSPQRGRSPQPVARPPVVMSGAASGGWPSQAPVQMQHPAAHNSRGTWSPIAQTRQSVVVPSRPLTPPAAAVRAVTPTGGIVQGAWGTLPSRLPSEPRLI